jgi:polyphosphate kinase 2 (PPK2 family)
MIDLADFERGRRYHGRYKHDLAKLQERLQRALAAHIVHGRRAILAFEGWDCAGKDGIIERLTEGWSEGHHRVWPVGAPTRTEHAHDFLWRFRSKLPAAGEITLFDRTWYGRVLVERVESLIPEKEWRASYTAINRFEKSLADKGVTLIKLFIHITQKEQDKRLRARLDEPWKRWKTGANDFRNRSFRAGYLDAMHEMFARTDRPHARWQVIDGNDKKAARITALTYIADQLEAAVPMDPPALDPDIAALATREIGWRPKKREAVP